MSALTIEDKQLISRSEDLLDMAERQYTLKHSDFLSPHEQALLKRSIKAPKDIKIEFFGGYVECERSIMLLYPTDFELKDFDDTPIAALLIEGRELETMSHRDYLGSLLGLGLRRDKIGDIIPDGDKCYVFVLAEIAPYIQLNLTKIGNKGVSVSVIETDNIVLPEKKTQSIHGTVSSLRLDSVLALALNTSRSKAVEYLRSGRVMLNWEEESNVSKSVKAGDMLSVRGVGRIKLSEIGGLSAKGRTHIRMEKYI